MQKKAAIVTWCNNNRETNYGQILQCYAVQKIVDSWGYEAFIVVYQREGAVVEEDTKRAERFYKFASDYIRRSIPCYTKEDVERATEDCELLVCGSDQIWNPINFDPIYFLDFGTDKQKRIAFAVSGIFEDRDEFKEIYRKMAKLIGRLDRVTLREQTGLNILKKYTRKAMETIPDPTLQLSIEEWDQVIADRIEKENYIFCYVIGSLRPYQLIIRKVAELYGTAKILYIPSNVVKEGALPYFYRVDDIGPSEFLSLIKYAKAVCTDSFHGVTMSMVYHIPFFGLPRYQPGAEMYGSNVRVYDLLKARKLEHRIVHNVREVLEMKKRK